MKRLIVILIALVVAIGAGVLAGILFFEKKGDVDNRTTQEIKTQEWFDIAFDTIDIEEKYDFTGDDESNLKNFEQMSVELENLFDGMIEDGTLESYEKGLFSYFLYFTDGLSYVYSAPFTVGNILSGSGEVLPGSDIGDISVYAADTGMDATAEKGQILVVENCSNQRVCPHVLQSCAEAVVNSGLNYCMHYYGEDDCNSMETVYRMLMSWAQYDIIIWEGHGEFVDDGQKSGKIYIANNIPFAEYEAFIAEHPEFDCTTENPLPGLKIGTASYGWADGTESERQRRYTKNGKVIKTISILIDAETIDFLYKDDSLKDTIIYFGCCFSGQNDILSNTLLRKGARAVMTYANAVNAEYHSPMAKCIWSRLPVIEYDSGELWTVEDAVKYAKECFGEKDETLSDDSLLNRLLGRYDEEEVRSYICLYTSEKDVQLIDYSTEPVIEESEATQDEEETQDIENVTPESLDQYADCFESGIKENNTFLTEEQLSAENDIYNDVLQRLKEEDSTDMADALKAAMKLFFIVSCDNGHMTSYGKYQENQKYTKLGMGYYTDIINSYAKDGRIGTYNLNYIGAQYGNPTNAMQDYMAARDARSLVSSEYTSTEKEALELCKRYLATFYNHRGNIETVADALITYCNGFSEKDINRDILKKNKEVYENGVQEYYETLAQFESYLQ